MIYIYALLDPRDGRLRYVGKTNDLKSRRRAHRNEKYCSRKCYWAAKLKRLGLEPDWLILSELPDDTNWQAIERLWISTLRESCELLNQSDGGDGRSGYEMSAGSRAKIRAAAIGRRHTAAARRRMHASHVGRAVPVEQCEKISAALRGRKKSADHLAKIAAGCRGHPALVAQARKLGRANKGRRAGDETRAKMRAAQQRRRVQEQNGSRKISDETRQKLQQAALQREARKCRAHEALRVA